MIPLGGPPIRDLPNSPAMWPRDLSGFSVPTLAVPAALQDPAAGTTTYSRYRHGRRQGRCLLRVVSANDTRSELWLLQSHLEGLRRAYPGAESAPWRLKWASRSPFASRKVAYCSQMR